jgi:hypothetical protein
MKYVKMLFCILMIFVGAKYGTKDINIWLCLLAYSWIDVITSND